MRRDRIVFWQEAPYGDRSAYERALAVRMAPSPVLVAVCRSSSTDFKHGVWGSLEFAAAEVVVVSDAGVMGRMLDTDPARSVHIISSFVHSAALRDALETACRSGALVGLLSEARDWRGWKGLARRCHSVLHERRYRHRVDFVLAIGHLGQEWFEKTCGYPAEKVFPWCYVSERAADDVGSSRGEGFGLVYIEAMRRGLPVIASVHDAAPEVNLDGITGYNVDLDRPDELPERLIALLRDPDHAATLGRAGHARWADNFRYSAFRGRLRRLLGPLASATLGRS